MRELISGAGRQAAQRRKVSSIVLGAGCLLGVTCPAWAEKPAPIKDISFTTQSVYSQVIRVVSSDNKKWDSFKPGTVSFGAHVMIDTRHAVLPSFPKGWVKYAGIVLGDCGGAACKGKPLLWGVNPMTKDYENQMAVTFPTSQIPISTTGIATVPVGDQIISKCNSQVTPTGGEAHSFNQVVPATFVADTVWAVTPQSDGGGGVGSASVWMQQVDHSRTAHFMVKVECEAFQGELAEDVEDVNMVTEDIALSVVAPASPTTQPNPATTCRKARLTVRMEANRTGPMKYRLWSKAGDEPMTSKVIDMWASEVEPQKFVAEHSEWVTVSKTSTVQAMAEDMINEFGESTGWKSALVRCTPGGGGGGGFVDAPNPNDDGPLVQPLQVTGELTLVDQAGVPKDKPRTAKAKFKIIASKPNSTSYRLTCTGGRQWEGTPPTIVLAGNKYQATGTYDLQITKTEQIGCALRSTSKSGEPVIALASKLFTLVKRNPNIGGGNSITGKPKPQTNDKPSKRPQVVVTPKPPKRAKKPKIKVAPKPKLVCINGKVSRNTCFCPARTVKKRIGATAYRCDRAVAKPKLVIPKTPPRRLKPRTPPRRVIKRPPPKRATPKPVAPRRAKPKRSAPATAAPAARTLRLRTR